MVRRLRLGVLARLGALAAIALGAVACAAPIKLPQSFVELGDRGEGYRAITSDNARLWVRKMFDATEGDVVFWADTLKRDLVDERGYELRSEGDAKNLDGDEGRWLELTANVRGQRIDYLVAVWVQGDWLGKGNWLRIVEFAATHDVYVGRVEAVRAALATVR